MKIVKFLTNFKSCATKNSWCALVILIFSQTAFCQTTDQPQRKKRYHVNYISGSIIIAGGLATDYPSIGRIKNKTDITSAELLDLNTRILNPLDKWEIEQNPSQYLMFSKLSDDIEPPIFIVLPALLGLDKKIRK